MSSDPGRSAREHYERLRGRELAARRERLPLALAVVIGVTAAVFAAVEVGADAFAHRFNADLSPTIRNELAVLVALAVDINLARAVWGRRQSTEAWRVGAEGEEATAAQLAPLGDRGSVVLHDRKLPGLRANVDHIVIGPTGVFTIETKNYSGTVTLRRRLIPWRVVALHGGRRLDGVVHQAQTQADAVEAALHGQAVRVVPIVVVQRAELTVTLFASAWTDGVRWISGGRLQRILRAGPRTLSSEQVSDIAGIIQVAFKTASGRAVAETCVCGEDMVLRHRRRDQVAFLGCTSYPACRHTRPVPC